jgi:polyphosphate:AMP phosphotransferase
MQRIVESERMFTDDGTLLIKLWFHLPAAVAAERVALDRLRDFPDIEVPRTGTDFHERYEELKAVSERAIRATDTGHSPWHLVEATDDNYRDLTAAQTVQQCLAARLDTSYRSPANTSPISLSQKDQPTILDRLPMDASLESDAYREQLDHYQARLDNLAWEARHHRLPCVAVFEGWDAAGKGSAIRRVTQAIDPRLFHLHQFAAPTDEEAAHHYLWRFWRKLGRDGSFTLFDRSWYGRVLVERVEGLATESEWQRAYGEINRFEAQIIDHGTVFLKFWIHISKDEQYRRFKEREKIPRKQHKITEEDWRNRDRWRDYEVAVHDMVTHTSTGFAPWTLVAGNDKRHARIQVLKAFCEQLQQGLNSLNAGAEKHNRDGPGH